MQKLIDAYKANPTAKNAARVIAHGEKHPFSTLMISSADLKLLESLKWGPRINFI